MEKNTNILFAQKIIFCISIFTIPIFNLIAQEKTAWENETLLDQNKEKARATFILHTDIDAVRNDDPAKSPFYQSLNGIWKFAYSPSVEEKSTEFYKEDFNDSKWADLPVPSNWELNGFGIPIYVNIRYPFQSHKLPFVGKNNPVGSYRKTFTVPEEWKDREVILNFGSITGCAFVFVNGQRVGMSKVSKSPAEFNITKYLKPGSNLLAVEVIRWHDGSYLEDQDFWRLSGIERDVFLQAYPKTSIWDFFIQADLDSKYTNGLFKAVVDLRQFSGSTIKNATLKVELFDPNKNKVFSSEKKVDIRDSIQQVTFNGTVKKVLKWSAEYPNLYDCIIKLQNGEGKGTTVAGSKIGFRKVEIKDAQLHINGVPILVKGVNRHEHDEVKGHVPNKDLTLKDMQLMKQFNINAIRTSHYPNDPHFYKLCDKYGFYVVDEANIESHGSGSLPWFSDTTRHPAYLASWAPAHMDRINRLIETNKNHPSIIIWSMGNECGNGKVFHDAYRWMKQRDPLRPVQFEQALEDWNTDIVCPMYPGTWQMKQYAQSNKTRPYIMCEYSHSMGNSSGNFQEYWDIIMSSKRMQGGFNWDWVDQGIKATDAYGRTYWGYGGDFGSHTLYHDENGCSDGLISANRIPHPGLYEVKKVYQNILFKTDNISNGMITVRNLFNFTNLNQYDFKWQILKNGQPFSEQAFVVDLPPNQTKAIKLTLPSIPQEQGVEYLINLLAFTKTATDLIPAGHEIAREQFVLSDGKYFSRPLDSGGNLEITRDGNKLRFRSGIIRGEFNTERGELSSYGMDNSWLISRYPTPYFWRAPTDNDFGSNMPSRLGVWRQAHDNRKVTKVTVGEKTQEGLSVKIDYTLTGIDIPYSVEYHIQNDGALRITASIDMSGKELPELPRFGMRMELPGYLSNLKYYGRGPWENYSDRNTAALIGIYSGPVADQYVNNYTRPQENGYKTDTRWISLMNNEGNIGVMIEGLQPISFSALNVSTEDLDPGLTKKQRHVNDIVPQNTVYLHIDLKQRGLGGDTSWGAWPHDPFRLTGKKYSYSYILRPVKF